MNRLAGALCSLILLYGGGCGKPVRTPIAPQKANPATSQESVVPEMHIYSDESLTDWKAMRLKPVVQFSCVREWTPLEDALEKDLTGTDDRAKLESLSKLVGRSAPSSVPLQYEAFQDLRRKYADDARIKDAAKAFSEQHIQSVVSQSPPQDEFSSNTTEYYWCIRAVGVLRLDGHLPRLLELSAAKDLDTTLAAERSIEDFDEKKSEDALLQVISCWQYDAFERAAFTMARRNPGRLSLALEQMTPPGEHKYLYAIFLARCKNPKAVPILCATVGSVAIVDREMFEHIAALGRQSDEAIILALPDNVRSEQREQAKACVAKYLLRMKENADTPPPASNP